MNLFLWIFASCRIEISWWRSSVKSLPDLRLDTIFTQYCCFSEWSSPTDFGVHNFTLAKRPRASTLDSIVYKSVIEELVTTGGCKTDFVVIEFELLVFAVLEVFGTFIGELEGIFVFGVMIAEFWTFWAFVDIFGYLLFIELLLLLLLLVVCRAACISILSLFWTRKRAHALDRESKSRGGGEKERGMGVFQDSSQIKKKTER